jgi:hypothetical protein
MTSRSKSTLADRLGLTVHQSPVRFKIRRFLDGGRDEHVEHWLIQVANARGAKVITNPPPEGFVCRVPDASEFSNEELVCALIQPNCRDYPQILRLAAQLISRGDVDMLALISLCGRERSIRILAEIARQALRVNPSHASWMMIAERTADQKKLSEPIIHWTRLAEPIMEFGKPNARGWKLVA